MTEKNIAQIILTHAHNKLALHFAELHFENPVVTNEEFQPSPANEGAKQALEVLKNYIENKSAVSDPQVLAILQKALGETVILTENVNRFCKSYEAKQQKTAANSPLLSIL